MTGSPVLGRIRLAIGRPHGSRFGSFGALMAQLLAAEFDATSSWAPRSMRPETRSLEGVDGWGTNCAVRAWVLLASGSLIDSARASRNCDALDVTDLVMLDSELCRRM